MSKGISFRLLNEKALVTGIFFGAIQTDMTSRVECLKR